jgi:LysR family cyn operon transcriptional activator
VIATIGQRDHATGMGLELRWLRSFLAVVEEHHFSRAARRLNLAQPALTAHIHQLEEAVGAVLFERTNRLTGLTAAGRALWPEARAIVERTDHLADTVRRARSGEAGELRLGLIPPAATGEVAASFRLLAREMPGIALSVRQGDQEKLEHRLLAGELDLLLGRAPAGSGAGGLRRRRLFVEEQGILLEAGDARSRLESVPMRALDGARLVLLRGHPHFGQVMLAHAARLGVTLNTLAVADDFPSLHWLVRAGLGVAPCSLLLADTLPAGLVARPVRPALPKLEIHAVWRGQVPPPCAARWLQLIDARIARV